jgi:hypothetical protein
MATRAEADKWLQSLKTAWEAGDGEGALALFARTEKYYERPFEPGTTQEDYRRYWKDIDGLVDIRFDYEIVAVDGDNVCAHWQNSFRTEPDGEEQLLDGMFLIVFDRDGHCREFRQWWFAR